MLIHHETLVRYFSNTQAPLSHLLLLKTVETLFGRNTIGPDSVESWCAKESLITQGTSLEQFFFLTWGLSTVFQTFGLKNQRGIGTELPYFGFPIGKGR